MARNTLPERLVSSDILQRQLRALLRRDARLRPIARIAGAFEIRLTPGGFPGLVRIVCGQQLSVASARAIYGRYAELPGALTATVLPLRSAMVLMPLRATMPSAP